MSLREELVAAWQERFDRTVDTLTHATTAPALFKPEAVEAAIKDGSRAHGMTRYFGSQS